MSDRVTANLPSRDFDATITFYEMFGFACGYRDGDWLILERGTLEIEFFYAPETDPWSSDHSACIRVDDLAALWDGFAPAGLSGDPRDIPRMTPPDEIADGLFMFAVVDLDGNLLRCLGTE